MSSHTITKTTSTATTTATSISTTTSEKQPSDGNQKLPSFKQLPHLISSDIKQITDHDPAYTTPLDLLFYPGLCALILYRFAHVLYTTYHFKFLGKFICFMARMLTGVEIHPAAQIGHSCFIDHGHGVVIGETAIMGHHCTLFHGVTLGGTGKEFGKRHPTLGNHVKVGAGAKVLGNIYIGTGSKVGAGSVVVKDVPDHSTVVGIPARCIRNCSKHQHLSVVGTSSSTVGGEGVGTNNNLAKKENLIGGDVDGEKLKKNVAAATTTTTTATVGENLSPSSPSSSSSSSSGGVVPLVTDESTVSGLTVSPSLLSVSEKKRAVHMPDIDAEAIRALYRRELRLETELKIMTRRLMVLEKSAAAACRGQHHSGSDDDGEVHSPKMGELATVYERNKDDDSLDLLVRQVQVELMDGAGI